MVRHFWCDLSLFWRFDSFVVPYFESNWHSPFAIRYSRFAICHPLQAHPLPAKVSTILLCWWTCSKCFHFNPVFISLHFTHVHPVRQWRRTRFQQSIEKARADRHPNVAPIDHRTAPPNGTAVNSIHTSFSVMSRLLDAPSLQIVH